jgi:glucokinase
MVYVGIDLGATNLRIAIGDGRGVMLQRRQERTERNRGPEGVVNQLIRMIDSFKLDITEVEGIGIGCIGPIDIERGVIVLAPNLPFNHIPLKEPLTAVYDVPIRILNDCSAAVIGERMVGAGKEIDNLAYITLSSGIGCGVYVDGRLVVGKDGNATEMGHSIIDMNG